jgi:hypothetical protein
MLTLKQKSIRRRARGALSGGKDRDRDFAVGEVPALRLGQASESAPVCMENVAPALQFREGG